MYACASGAVNGLLETYMLVFFGCHGGQVGPRTICCGLSEKTLEDGHNDSHAEATSGFIIAGETRLDDAGTHGVHDDLWSNSSLSYVSNSRNGCTRGGEREKMLLTAPCRRRRY